MALFGDHMQFEMAYKQYYSMLVGFAFQYVEDGDIAEDVVQEVFSNLWNQSDRIEVKTNVKSYLFGAVRNASLNHLKHLKVVESHAKMTTQPEASDPTDFIEMDELQEKIESALAQLPEKRRQIFEMSRFEEKKYHEIAKELDISIKTVETQMSRALKVMREVLGSYLMYLIIFSLIMLIEGCRGEI
ncbi:MAG: RNA polymerase sigma-70 factor [Cyclobacteriaceae bacterium]